MPFIGQQPTQGRFIELDSLTASATANYTLQLNSANFSPESVNNLLVSINGVIQGSSTMSLNGAVLTVGATLSSSDTIDFVRVFGNVGTVSTPTDGSVTANKIGTGAVTSAKLDISATNKPSFKAYLSSNQAQTQNSVTQIVYNAELYDSDSTYDTSNGRFTPAVVGKYFVNASVGIDGADANGRLRIYIYKNGSNYAFASYGIGDTADDGGVHQVSAIVELDADDYVTAHIEYTGTDNVVGQQAKTWFEAFKLIGA